MPGEPGVRVVPGGGGHCPLPSIFVLPPVQAPALRTPAHPLLEATLGEIPFRVKATQGGGGTREFRGLER